MLTLSLPPAPISRGAAPPSAETPRVEVIDAPLIEVELPSPPREPTAVAEDVVDEAPHELGEEDANGAPPRAEAEWDDLFAEPSPPSGLPRPMTAPPGVLRPVLDVAAAALALEDATTRDEVGETLTTWLLSEYECGLVLIVKDGLALGWKGHAPDAEQDIIESIAMPLGPPSMLTAAYEQRVAVCGPPPSEGAALQTRLWKLLRCSPPSEVLVAPIVLGQRVVNLLYAHTSATFPSSTASDATRVAAAASSAYARLIRQKK